MRDAKWEAVSEDSYSPVWVWVVEEALNAGEDSSDIVCGTPAVLEYVQAQLAVRVHVRMEHAR